MSAFLALAVIAASYLVGSIPIAQLVARYTKRIDLREVGSGNVGASNVWQSVERWLVVPVGLAQIGQVLTGVLLGLTWPSLGVFIAVSLVGVAVGWIPQFVALALFAAPFGEVFFGDSAAAAWGAFALAVIAMVKRVRGNARPGIEVPRPDVWLNRLVYDRDVLDRDAWVRRGLSRTSARKSD